MISTFLTSLILLFSFVSGQTVQTQYGPVTGTTLTANKVWYGIPYAAPPIGNLRFQSPQPPSNWSTPIIANNLVQCIQNDNGFSGQSEDCLYLNIATPLSATSSSNLPVLVWIHGGSFITGSGYIYNGTYLARSDIIYVSVNYRLGALGFLALPELLANSTTNSTGFYGMQDQRLALRWVRDNIAAFGGDPNRVTIAGESAGAVSICLHIASEKSRGLFDRAIIQSGYCPTTTQEAGYTRGSQIKTQLGCQDNTVECLRNLPAATIYNATKTITPFLPSLGADLPARPLSVLAQDGGIRVPMLIGTNHDEYGYVYCITKPNLTETEYKAMVGAVAPAVYKEDILRNYPVSAYSAPVKALLAVLQDSSFDCESVLMADAFSKSGSGSPAYLYSLIHGPAAISSDCLGAAHSFDLYYLFESFRLNAVNRVISFTQDEQVLRETMRTAWVSFVANGVPTLPNFAWPTYSIP